METLTKKEEMYKRIEKHGEDLKRAFKLDDSTDPIKLCKSLRRLETKAHRLSTDYCNGVIDSDKFDFESNKILAKVDDLLDYINADVHVFINGDARGYAIKIDFDDTDARSINLYQDWGGYGIIAPDFS